MKINKIFYYLYPTILVAVTIFCTSILGNDVFDYHGTLGLIFFNMLSCLGLSLIVYMSDKEYLCDMDSSLIYLVISGALLLQIKFSDDIVEKDYIWVKSDKIISETIFYNQDVLEKVTTYDYCKIKGDGAVNLDVKKDEIILTEMNFRVDYDDYDTIGIITTYGDIFGYKYIKNYNSTLILNKNKNRKEIKIWK